jgi:hypothetical protein
MDEDTEVKEHFDRNIYRPVQILNGESILVDLHTYWVTT